VIESVLVANRGEIALRLIRACRELGVRVVAVYSEADANALHVAAADEAVCIGPAPAVESYLRGDRILEAAHRTGARAIHPGYGFLAEREAFARAVEEAGLVFVGPTADTIAAMGDKTEARRRMRAAGVPIVPGVEHALRDAKEALEVAADIGYPVLLKASAGGGGKGMRVVRDPTELPSAFGAAGREAAAAFGDGSVYAEKLLERPRHIEIQVLGDSRGTVVHLGERECSIQRRHQKLVEEAPSVVVTPEMRAAMGEAATDAARAVAYVGAGTVEFLYEDGDFYFLEMNTRLQVEHPVTELVTGLDLVHWQLRIASGEALDFGQEDVAWQGHAIECRITSEDPFRSFLPSTGCVEHLEVPAGPGVRWDGGIEEGYEVGLHYDPLLAKLIVHGRDRATAIRRMRRALEELVISGVETSTELHRRVMCEPDFLGGRLTIGYLDEHPGLTEPDMELDASRVAAVAAALLADRDRARLDAKRIGADGGAGFSAWRALPWSHRHGHRGARW
jgi:acetyl-CoA carboxylase biotin carboxylase subunit